MTGKPGRVWLVGAGCGSADLVTLRGLRALRRCQAVVYDGLIDRELLSFAPEGAERIYMGKRSGRPSASQGEICGTLIRLAREGKEVVRLKGGDPYVFGRGGEEAAALAEAGIPWEEVPGITSAIAIPAAAGIPVTCRRLSRSVHIVTAHTAGAEGGLPEDIGELARLHGTLVFLMGLGQLPNIVKALLAAGKDPETPAAVLSGGNAPHPAAVRGPLRRLPRLAEEAKVQAPAVIVVGAVAGLALEGGMARPLAGVRVGLTGTPALLKKLSGPLREQGAQVFTALRMEPRPLPFSLADLAGRINTGNLPPWLIFTSGNGVDRFFQALEEQGMDIRTFGACRFAAVGPATGRALGRHGIQADLMPPVHTTAALGQALIKMIPPETPLVLLRSAQADSSLPALLEEAGFTSVEDIRIYDVHPRRQAWQAPSGTGAVCRTGAETGAVCQTEAVCQADYLVFSSAGGVRAFLAAYGTIPPGAVCVCIGAVTASALEEASCGYPVLIAPEISAPGIVQAILSHAGGGTR